MDYQKQIINILEKSNRNLNSKEILELSGCNTLESQRKLLSTIDVMSANGLLFLNDKNKYIYLNPEKYQVGNIIIKDQGFGFISTRSDEDDFYVSARNTDFALDGDKVLFEVITKDNKKKSDKFKLEAKVVKILERTSQKIIGVFLKNFQNKLIFKIQNAKLQNYKVKIINSAKGIDGNLFIAKVLKFLPNKIIEIELIKNLGPSNYPGNDIMAIAYEKGIKTSFSKKTIDFVEKLPNEITLDMCTKDSTRIDHTNDLLITIDGEDSKDFDDAICVEKLDNGCYKLIVSIADVSHYVKPFSVLDSDALKKGCSYYLINKVIPMLPEKLSNDLCSLRPNELRLSMSCAMTINNKGEVVESSIYHSFMKSHARLTYNKVNNFFNGEEHDIPEDVASMLLKAKELFLILKRTRKNKGTIEFNSKEPKFIMSSQNKIIDIKFRVQKDAEELIEYFMVSANETVAKTIEDRGLPFVYRIHDKSSEKKWLELYQHLKFLGLDVPNYGLENLKPKNLQDMLNSFSDNENFHVISKIFLRSMEKAKYDINNIGHFGLASKSYTHFTSPIRRYPDLMVHRLLKEYLYTNIEEKKLKKNLSLIKFQLDMSNLNEIKSLECERKVNQMKMAEYMEDKVGEVFEAVISGVVRFGLFVELENTIEGLVHIKEIKDDFYIFNIDSKTLVGERKKRQFQIGQSIKVRLLRASKVTQKIDFELV